MKIIHKIVLGGVMLLSSHAVLAASQVVATNPSSIQAVPGGAVVFHVTYTTDDGNGALTGLGLRIHYDSSELEWAGFESVYGNGLVMMDTTPQDDVEDFDHDANTDKYLGFGWISFAGQWPGHLPAALFDASFQVVPGLSASSTSMINFSSSSKVTGYGFDGVAGIVELKP